MMKTLVCPLVPFPNIYWWSYAFNADTILLDQAEHFEKMSLRNRYLVSGSGGLNTLSIPIAEGRQQRKPMNEVKIDYKSDWQKKHWRTLQTVYNRSPYFEFFNQDIQSLYLQKFDMLIDFNEASIHLMAQLLNIKLNLNKTGFYQKNYPEIITDIRGDFRSNQYNLYPEEYPVYHQIFEDRLGFLPNLSILDLLFAEGKNSTAYFIKK